MDGRPDSDGQSADDVDFTLQLVRNIDQLRAYVDKLSRHQCPVGRTENEDLLHDAFCRALYKKWQFRGKSLEELQAWLKTIIRRIRCSSIRRRVHIDVLPQDVPSHDPGPDSIVERRELCRRLIQAVEELPSGDRQLIDYRFDQGLTHRDIAGLLGIPEQTVRKRLERAIKRLKKKIR
jgi:RNA polymerase sigma-70 factor (ECF subfamily)